MPHGRDVDYTRTSQADTNRAAKARQLAHWCWHHAIPPTDITTWDQPTRRRAARTAGVNPPHRLSPTWDLVTALLDQMAIWADRHPDDARARPRHTSERPSWTQPKEGNQ
jgi:hypothetical protein